jgi:hypothetical protein
MIRNAGTQAARSWRTTGLGGRIRISRPLSFATVHQFLESELRFAIHRLARILQQPKMPAASLGDDRLHLVIRGFGQPYNETSGRDDNHEGVANDRPPGVPRNSLQGPGYVDLDLRCSHDFFLARARKDKGPTVTLGFDAFNVLNKVNYVAYIGNLTSPFFGQPVAAQPPRKLQLSFRFRF